MPKLADVLLAFGRNSTAKMKANLERKGKNASGALTASIDFSQRVFAGTFVLSIEMEDYYDVVDLGRRPGKRPPPYDPNTKEGVLNSSKRPFGWVQNKPAAQLIVQSMAAKYLAAHPNTRLTNAEIFKLMRRSFAYLVSRKIAKKGIKGSRFFSDVINPRTLATLDKKIDGAINDELNLDNILE